jgi:hypothetical protein
LTSGAACTGGNGNNDRDGTTDKKNTESFAAGVSKVSPPSTVNTIDTVNPNNIVNTHRPEIQKQVDAVLFFMGWC